ncbi:MAG: 6-phosphogluconolactonase [Rhizobacter sp.]
MTANVLLHRSADATEQAAALAREVSDRLVDAIQARGHALLAVSGGSTPVRLFSALRDFALPWERVTVILVDERCVNSEHADSNAALVRRHLLQHAAAAAHWLPFFDQPLSDLASDAALDSLALEACRRLAALPWPLDVAVLGMGEDGHTASLFAGAPGLPVALQGQGPVAWIRPVIAPHARLTLTLPTLLAARCLVLPLVGTAKRAVFDRACVEPNPELPISLVLHHSARPVQVWLATKA